MFLILLCELAVLVLLVASSWVLYSKAGRQGWEAIVPIYNVYVLTLLVGRPWWWLLLLFVPVVNIVIGIVLTADLARSFGKSIPFAVGMILLPFIFVPLLAFSDDPYVGPAATGH